MLLNVVVKSVILLVNPMLRFYVTLSRTLVSSDEGADEPEVGGIACGGEISH